MLLLQLAAMICVHDELSITYTSLSGGQVLVFIHDHPVKLPNGTGPGVVPFNFHFPGSPGNGTDSARWI